MARQVGVPHPSRRVDLAASGTLSESPNCPLVALVHGDVTITCDSKAFRLTCACAADESCCNPPRHGKRLIVDVAVANLSLVNESASNAATVWLGHNAP